MHLTSRDLSPDVRAQLLHELTTRLGWAEYNRLVKIHGEDGLLDLVLRQVEPQRRSSTPSRQPFDLSVDPSKVGLSPWWLFVFGCVLWAFAGLHLYNHPRPPGGPEGIQWENFNWAWYWKILLGIVGIVLDFLALVRVAVYYSSPSTRSDSTSSGSWSSGSQSLDGCLGWLLEVIQAVFLMWPVGMAFLAGVGGGPILLVWGIVDLFR